MTVPKVALQQKTKRVFENRQTFEKPMQIEPRHLSLSKMCETEAQNHQTLQPDNFTRTTHFPTNQCTGYNRKHQDNRVNSFKKIRNR